jgi:glycosyltransferase involved in cell wall biosynthesis
MKLLMIGQLPPPYGGQSIHIGKMRDILEEDGFDFKFLEMKFSRDLSENGKFAFRKVLRLGLLLFRLIWILLKDRPKYVYFPVSGAEKVPVYRDIALLLPIRLLRRKVIFHFHAAGLSDVFGGLAAPIRWLGRIAYFKPERSICPSPIGLRDPKFLGCDANSTIPYGIGRPERGSSPVARGSGFQVLFVGVCRESKGILDFIQAIRLARRKEPAIRGVIVGSIFGIKEEREIRAAMAEGAVAYEGIKTGSSKNEIFASSQAFFFPTFFEHESFPTVILEAFSFGLPVVATRWRGVLDQVIPNGNGYLHEVHEVQGMSESLVSLCRDFELRERMSACARDSYERYYTDEIFRRNVIGFFRGLK